MGASRGNPPDLPRSARFPANPTARRSPTESGPRNSAIATHSPAPSAAPPRAAASSWQPSRQQRLASEAPLQTQLQGWIDNDICNVPIRRDAAAAAILSAQRSNAALLQLEGLISLPDCLTLLPELQELELRNCHLDTLPALPPQLLVLRVTSAGLTTLPPLPDTLQLLNVGDNALTALPALPSGLTGLFVPHNRLQALLPHPALLPPRLAMLDAANNQLQALPPLPPSLRTIDVHANFLATLPPLPDALTALDAADNLLTQLPALPTGLADLDVSCNLLKALPPSVFTLSAPGWLDAEANPLSMEALASATRTSHAGRVRVAIIEADAEPQAPQPGVLRLSDPDLDPIAEEIVAWYGMCGISDFEFDEPVHDYANEDDDPEAASGNPLQADDAHQDADDDALSIDLEGLILQWQRVRQQHHAGLPIAEPAPAPAFPPFLCLIRRLRTSLRDADRFHRRQLASRVMELLLDGGEDPDLQDIFHAAVSEALHLGSGHAEAALNRIAVASIHHEAIRLARNTTDIVTYAQSLAAPASGAPPHTGRSLNDIQDQDPDASPQITSLLGWVPWLIYLDARMTPDLASAYVTLLQTRDGLLASLQRLDQQCVIAEAVSGESSVSVMALHAAIDAVEQDLEELPELTVHPVRLAMTRQILDGTQ